MERKNNWGRGEEKEDQVSEVKVNEKTEQVDQDGIEEVGVAVEHLLSPSSPCRHTCAAYVR